MMHEDRSETDRPAGDERCLTRRQMLKTLGAVAVASTFCTAFPGTFASAGTRPAASESPIPEGCVEQAVTSRATAFNVAAVRLLEGPFRRAQERDGQYLLQLEPDRLLHNFRVNAGLAPKAPVYG